MRKQSIVVLFNSYIVQPLFHRHALSVGFKRKWETKSTHMQGYNANPKTLYCAMLYITAYLQLYLRKPSQSCVLFLLIFDRFKPLFL